MAMAREEIMTVTPIETTPTGALAGSHLATDAAPVFGTFLLAGQEFAIAVSRVRETIPFPGTIVRVPASIAMVEGIIDLRGSIIPIINLKTRLGLEPRQYAANCKVAIVNCLGGYFGLLFDDIREVLRPGPGSIHAMASGSDTGPMAVCGVISLAHGQRLIQIIDPDRLLQNRDIPLLARDSHVAEAEELRRRPKVETLQAIVFRSADQEFAIDVKNIREIIRVPAIERRLLVDEFIKGVMALRGELLTVVDLGMYMGLGARIVDGDSRIIVLEGAARCGILVDSIHEVITFAKSCVRPIPLLSDHGLQQAYKGLVSLVGNGVDRHFILLDAEKLFSDRLRERFEQNIILHRDREAARQRSEIEQEKANLMTGGYDDKVMVSFSLGQPFAVDILALREIIRHDATIVSLPGQPRSIEGVLNLRGTIVPVVNLRSYYPLNEVEKHGDEKILILANERRCAGIVVDDLIEILKIEKGRYHHVHRMLGDQGPEKFKNHVGKILKVANRDGEEKTVIVFDAENFLDDLDLTIATGERTAIRRYDADEPVESFVV